jgi:hypothetical protein
MTRAPTCAGPINAPRLTAIASVNPRACISARMCTEITVMMIEAMVSPAAITTKA